jgi:DNA-binding CsgD family transcriptional regulator
MQTEYEKRIAWARKRRDKIVQLRRNGLSYREIADELGITPQRVEQIVKKAMAL